MSKTLENMTDAELIRLIVKTEVDSQLEERTRAKEAEKAAAAQDPFANIMKKYGR